MTKLYANENFPLHVVKKLREHGYDILTTLEAGNAGQAIPDDQVLEFAKQNSRIVITLNRKDFIQLHKTNAEHPGIIVCSQDPDIERQAEMIHKEITSNLPLNGKLIRVNRPQQ